MKTEGEIVRCEPDSKKRLQKLGARLAIGTPIFVCSLLFSLYSFLLFYKNAELFFKTDTCTSVHLGPFLCKCHGGKTIHLIIQESQLYLLYLKETVKIFVSAPSP